MGMQVFGKYYKEANFEEGVVPRWNFQDFLHSFMIVFRVLCGEWIESMWDCMRSTKAIYLCVPFFMLTMIIGNLVVLNLFLALLLSSFGTESLAQNVEATTDINKLQEALDRLMRWFTFCKMHFITRTNKNVAQYRTRIKEMKKKGANILMNVNSKNAVIKSNTLMTVQQEDVNLQIKNQNLFKETEVELFADDENSNSNESAGDDMWDTTSSSTYVSQDMFETNGCKVSEVRVVQIDFPNDCCPKNWRWKYVVWENLLKTRVGIKWWTFRCYCKKLVDHRLFETFIILMILASSAALSVEDININKKKHLKETLYNLDRIFTVTFTMEFLLKLSAYGFIKYYKDAWCWLDFIIVVISIISLAAESHPDLSNMGALRALRTLRALRPLKAVSRWEGMRVVVNALFQAIPAIFNVLLVCLVFWLIFSIMGVTLFAGKFGFCSIDGSTLLNSSLVENKTQCFEFENATWINPMVNFDNVLASYLALFQVATFKGWIEIMRYATDVTEREKQPMKEENPLMYLYFVSFIVFGSFFTLNLFIGVIIDNFNVQKRRAGGSLDMFLTEDQKRYYNAMKKLGSKQPQKPIPKPQLRFQYFFFKLVSKQNFEIAIMLVIVSNMFCMSIEHHGQSDDLRDALDYVNQLFVAIFTLECVFKLLAYRLYYFKQPWNVFDFIVVCLSIFSLAGQALSFSPTLLRVVRVFRVGRVLRLVKSAKGIRTLLFSLAVSLPALFNIGLLLFLIMFIYSIFGMSFFMHVKHTAGIDSMFNFETFDRGLLLLFQSATSAGWNAVLDALRIEPPKCDPSIDNIKDKPNGDCGYGGVAVAYLVTYLIISFLVIINMYIAVILENFNQATEDVQQGLTQDDFDMYYEIWEKFDEQATGYIHLTQLSEFIEGLEEPLGIPAPNYFKIIQLDIPICDGDQIHCVDILDALTKNYLGTSKDAARALGDLKKGSGKKNYTCSTTTMQRQREIFCAKMIQIAWRKHVEKKRKEREQIDSVAAKYKERRAATTSFAKSTTQRKDSISSFEKENEVNNEVNNVNLLE